MLSPIYTPVSHSEAQSILSISAEKYLASVRAGELERSVHFDGRISDAVSLHSLVDLVRFRVLFLQCHAAASEGSVQMCESWLDTLCDLAEGWPEFDKLTDQCRAVDLLDHLASFSDQGTASLEDLAGVSQSPLLHEIISSWCHCYNGVAAILLAEQSS